MAEASAAAVEKAESVVGEGTAECPLCISTETGALATCGVCAQRLCIACVFRLQNPECPFCRAAWPLPPRENNLLLGHSSDSDAPASLVSDSPSLSEQEDQYRFRIAIRRRPHRARVPQPIALPDPVYNRVPGFSDDQESVTSVHSAPQSRLASYRPTRSEVEDPDFDPSSVTHSTTDSVTDSTVSGVPNASEDSDASEDLGSSRASSLVNETQRGGSSQECPICLYVRQINDALLGIQRLLLTPRSEVEDPDFDPSSVTHSTTDSVTDSTVSGVPNASEDSDASEDLGSSRASSLVNETQRGGGSHECPICLYVRQINDALLGIQRYHLHTTD